MLELGEILSFWFVWLGDLTDREVCTDGCADALCALVLLLGCCSCRKGTGIHMCVILCDPVLSVFVSV